MGLAEINALFSKGNFGLIRIAAYVRQLEEATGEWIWLAFSPASSLSWKSSCQSVPAAHTSGGEMSLGHMAEGTSTLAQINWILQVMHAKMLL